MSKLSDRIRKTLRLEPAPIGFGAARRERSPSLLTAVLLDRDDAKKSGEALEKGAGAILLKDAKPDEVKAVVEAAGEAPLGVLARQLDADGVNAFLEAGADFLVFDAETTPAAAVLNEKPGFVLRLESGQDETYLRALEAVSLDAVLLEEYRPPLTLRRQIELRLVAALTRKPLMLTVDLPVSREDLESLRDAGVTVLVVDSRDLAGLPQLLATVQEMPEPRRRREQALEALLPQAAMAAAAEEYDEDDDEDG